MNGLDSLAAVPTGFRDPIAIIGSGVDSQAEDTLRALWKLISEGRDGIVDILSDRWSIKRFWDPDPEQPGTIKSGGFMQQKIGEFDALFYRHHNAGLCVKNGQIPPVANLETPNPNIPFDRCQLLRLRRHQCPRSLTALS